MADGLEWSLAMTKHWLTIDRFYKGAPQLRAHFEKQFDQERVAHASRFVWDFWHVPEQYTLLRTPAYHYFPKALYESWHRQVVNWGREVLGCHDISPPWLSNYIEGCEQHIHADHPHGPWAFVFSLTPWQQRRFSGGETFILRPEAMQNWAHKGEFGLTERNQLIKEIAPKFNRLVVFDPRLPHGVNRVRGEMDPKWGRLVMHGWFVQPRPFFRGPLSSDEVADRLGGALQAISKDLVKTELEGYASARLEIRPSGVVSSVRWLTNTLVGAKGGAPHRVLRQMARVLEALRFSKRKTPSSITVPFRIGL